MHLTSLIARQVTIKVIEKIMCEIYIDSERLLLLTPKIEILERRLKESNFYENISVNGYSEIILFPENWPGNALEIYPFEIERRKNNPEILPYWTYNIIDKKAKTVIGDICCKSEPDIKNEIEIGYGINFTQQRKGYATEAVSMLTKYFFSSSAVSAIKTECNVSNISSIKVLEKCEFIKTGNRFDAEDGNLIIWKKRKPITNKDRLFYDE